MLTRLFRRAPWRRTRETESLADRNYRNLLINGAWWGMIDGGIVTFLPVFLARLGASAAVVGLATAGPSLVGILSYIPGGAYAERHTNMVKLLVRAAFLTRLTYPIIAILPFILPPSALPVVAVIIWSLSAIPTAVHMPAWTTIMQQAVPSDRRAHLNGTRWALYSLVSAVAVAAFGFMLDRTRFPLGYQIVFMVSFLSSMIHLYYFWIIKVPPYISRRDTESRPAGLGPRLAAFLRPFKTNRHFIRYNIGTLPYRLAYNLPIALYSIYWVRELQAPDTWIGLRSTVGYATLVFGYRFWGRTANRIGHRAVLLICGSLSALYPLGTLLAPDAQWLLPAALVWGFTVSGTDIALFDMLLGSCPTDRVPSFSAASNMLVSIVVCAGPLMGAALSQAIGIRPALMTAAALELLATLFFFYLPNHQQELEQTEC
jgi:MFS family permease